MSGKKYRARARTVQKMSRDGLVEENLRTGKRHRLTKDPEGVRIGDRPMELNSVHGDTVSGGMADRSLRLGRYGLLDGGTNWDGNLRREVPSLHSPDGVGSSGKRKRRRKRARESSRQKAPSSFFGQDGKKRLSREESGRIPTDLSAREDVTDEEMSEGSMEGGTRLRSSQYDALRMDRKAQLQDTAEEASETAPGTARRQRLQQNKRVLFQEHNAGLQGTDSDENGLWGTPQGPSPYARQLSNGEDLSDTEPETEASPSRQATRLQQTRGHPSVLDPSFQAVQAGRYAKNLHPGDGQKHRLEQEEGKAHRTVRLRETSADFEGLDSLKDEIRSKQKKERLNQEQRKAKAASRLAFDDEGGMIKGSGAGFSRKKGTAAGNMTARAGSTLSGAAGAAGGAVLRSVHAKVGEAAREDDNAAAQAVNDAGMASEASVRTMARASGRIRQTNRRSMAIRRKTDTPSSGRLLFSETEELKAAGNAKASAEKKAAVKKFFQKQRQRRMYAAAKKEEKAVETVFRTQQNMVAKAAQAARDAIVRNSRALLTLGIAGLVFMLASASVASCAALMQGAGSSVVSTTYPSADEDIYAVENRYRELEAGLDEQVNRMRRTHPDYDEFRYQIDEISHNPYHLISYFTTKYGQFTYDQVADEIEEIFREQYTLTTTGEQGLTITETQTIQPGDSLGQVVTSGYCSCEICCGPYAGGTTASGVYPSSGHTIAVDAFDPFVPLGTHVVMNGVEYVVEDTGAFGRFGVQFDVYYDDHQTALTHGHQTWDAWLASDNPGGALEVTTTRTINRMSVVLTNHDLDEVLQSRLTEDEKVRYGLYNVTFGNRDYLFDLNNLPVYGRAGSNYTIPPEALSDERFARMITEAEKYLGVPYVGGGYSPSGFDCSGFVSWVINHCGNGWDYGRLTAEGLRQVCYYVPPEDARPGDLIFFEHTYETDGASHIGIYVGNNMMIHCGEPVQYTATTGYWSDHFMQFGRLP